MRPIISIIVAMTPQGVIGNKGRLPWPRIPSDMKMFALVTKGKPLIMGRGTYRSILPKKGEPLPGRRKLVVGSYPSDVRRSNSTAVANPEEALAFTRFDEEVCIIGGPKIYEWFLWKITSHLPPYSGRSRRLFSSLPLLYARSSQASSFPRFL